MDALFTVPEPQNEPVGKGAPGSPERGRACNAARRLLAAERVELTMTIDGNSRMGGGDVHRMPSATAQ